MRDNLETYKIWAPDDALWTRWAKPVLFTRKPTINNQNLNIPKVNWIQNMDSHTMVIVDLPGESGVTESLTLARLGYRPVPLYNGVDGQTSSVIVKVWDIVAALYKGADELMTYDIRLNAPPVFMLDANRMTGSGKRPGTFDNRWCVFPQDMPSAAFLLKEGISRIIVRSDGIQNDLSHILHRYQDAGIDIYLCTGGDIEKKSIAKPSKYKSLSYRFKVIFGLTRNGTGGFGAMVPQETHGAG